MYLINDIILIIDVGEGRNRQMAVLSQPAATAPFPGAPEQMAYRRTRSTVMRVAYGQPVAARLRLVVARSPPLSSTRRR